MAGSSASLVVVISADINSFTKQFNAMTKGVEAAAKKIEKFGEALTIGITAPVVAATAKLAQLAAVSEDTAGRFARVFGALAPSVDASLKQMMQSVPETEQDLQKMAISIDNMAQGMGLAPRNAAQMSESLLKLAADASAFAHVPMEEALSAFERGLAGKTKGLLQFGIAIKEADVKQRAYDMGLLHTGSELTETGTALASYSLIMERAARIQGEAARTADQQGKSYQFLKRDMASLAEHVSTIVLPVVSSLESGMRSLIGALDGVDHSTVKTFFEFAAAAALIGPLVVGLLKMVKAVFEIRAAFALLSAGGGIGTFFGALASLPFATIVLGIVGVGIAIAAVVASWKMFVEMSHNARAGISVALGGTSDAPAFNGPSIPLSSVGTIDHKAPTLTHADLGSLAGDAKNDPTERLSGTPLEQFKKHAEELTKGFDAAVEHGRSVDAMLSKANTLHAEAARLIKAQGGAFNETAQAAQEVLDRVQQIKNAIELANAPTPTAQRAVLSRIARDQKSGFNAPQQAASDVAKETLDTSRSLELRFAKIQLPKLDTSGFEAVVKSLEDTRAHDEALALREALLKLPDGFNAAREAAVEFGESQRHYAEDLQKRLILSQKPSGFNAGTEAQVQSNETVKSTADSLALREALLQLPDGFNAARLATVEFGEAQRQYAEDLQKRLALSSKPSTFNAGTEAQIRSNEAVKGNADDLSLREALLALPDGFDAARQAAVEFGESQRTATESVALQYERLRINLDQFGITLGAVSARMQVAILTAASAAFQFAQQLVAGIGGKGSAANTGRGIGGLIGAIGGAFIPGIGPLVGSTVGGIIGTGIGGLIGGMFDHAKKSTDNASTAMDALAKTVATVTASITNIPQFFKVEPYRFEAAPIQAAPAPAPSPYPPGYPPGTVPTPQPQPNPVPNPNPIDPSSGGTPNGNVVNIANLTLNGIQNVADLLKQLQYENLKAKGTGSGARLAFSNSIG